jgi:hypothetical protein
MNSTEVDSKENTSTYWYYRVIVDMKNMERRLKSMLSFQHKVTLDRPDVDLSIMMKYVGS